METQSLRTLKYGENDGASKNVLAPAIALKNIFENFTSKCIAARLRVKSLLLLKSTFKH